MPNKPPEDQLLSIGALSKATGVGVQTIRTWERRYGFPEPHRMPSGHRRYPGSIIPKLRLIVRALEQGHKPSQMLRLSVNELRQRLALAGPGAERGAAEPTDFQQWFDLLDTLDGSALDRALQRGSQSMPLVQFLEETLAPFVREIGERWAAGQLDVVQEHVASERVTDLLSGIWTSLSGRAGGPTVVCAALPTEQHVLGLQMAATVMAFAGLHVTFTGANVPIEEIVKGVHRSSAIAVAISASESMAKATLLEHLRSIRRQIPEGVTMLLGGATHGLEIPGVLTFADLPSLEAFCATLMNTGR